ncbi:5'(3')-deoxyribonucleotidase, mitochondrial isoform X1 [Python bivittatus]|uniref:5'(3')-deoxyribonucleotidase, mitochondrial isoform X1 n=1 Tax=Python bivittatus TaxID=176946 RepID=A0A9F5ISB9_PYTBI|nr:5'(3')-deoxyribonucleotidase, mitochondrial isoform X1 [Python bivittatus]
MGFPVDGLDSRCLKKSHLSLVAFACWCVHLCLLFHPVQEKAISIWESKNFFMELDPLPGAVEALKQMAELEATDVFICTSPIRKYRYCPYEKLAWIEKHFGQEFLEHVVLTRDKTIVSGHVLIDDRPDIELNGLPPGSTCFSPPAITSICSSRLLAAGCTRGPMTGRPSWTASEAAKAGSVSQQGQQKAGLVA